MNSLRTSFSKWKQTTNERQKLQWVYGAVTIIGLVIAGLIGLVDREMADNMLQLVYAAGVLLIVNFVVWAILTAFIGNDHSSGPAPSAKKPQRK